MIRAANTFAIALLAAGALHAQQENETVFRSSPWTVARSVRDFGNSVGCTGFYRFHRGVQLSKDNMIIRTTAPIRSIAIGFAAQPPGTAREPTKLEQEMNAIVLAEPEFDQLKRSTRMTISLVTDKAQGNQPIDMRGMHEALANFDAGCPVPATPLPMVSPDAGAGHGQTWRHACGRGCGHARRRGGVRAAHGGADARERCDPGADSGDLPAVTIED